MVKEDLQNLSKEQIEEILLYIYERMNNQANFNKEAADKIGIDDDPGYYTYYAALKTMCNVTDIQVILALSEKRVK